MLTTTAVVVSTLLLAGCVRQEPVITPVPEPSSTPIFATDEEALAAATAAYAKYVALSDQISADGGENAERIVKYVTKEQALREIDAFKGWATSGESSTGNTKFDTVSLEQYVDRGSNVTVTVYLCVDVSAVRILDRSGKDVTPSARPNRVPLEVEFDIEGPKPIRLLISRSEPWPGTDFCRH